MTLFELISSVIGCVSQNSPMTSFIAETRAQQLLGKNDQLHFSICYANFDGVSVRNNMFVSYIDAAVVLFTSMAAVSCQGVAIAAARVGARFDVEELGAGSYHGSRRARDHPAGTVITVSSQSEIPCMCVHTSSTWMHSGINSSILHAPCVYLYVFVSRPQLIGKVVTSVIRTLVTTFAYALNF